MTRPGRRAFLTTVSAGAAMLAGCSRYNPFADQPNSTSVGEQFRYNARAQGIDGDGETEVGGKLQALLDTVHDEGGGIIYFPPGRYLFEQTPLIGSGTTLIGAGPATVFEGVRPAGQTGRALLSNRGYDETGYDGASNWTIRNLRIDSPETNGIMPAHAANVRLEQLYGNAILYHHVDVVSSRNVIVDGYWADRGGTASSNAPIQFDAQQRGVRSNTVWDGSETTRVADDDTPSSGCTLRNFEIEAENGPAYGVHIHRGPHDSLTIRDGSITGCQYTAVRCDPGEILTDLTVSNLSCRENARGITLGHVAGGRQGLSISDVRIDTTDSALAGGSGVYAAGFDGGHLSNVTVDGAFTNSLIFDDMAPLQLSDTTARGAEEQAYRFRENVEVTLTAARATDCGGAGIYSGPGSRVTYGGVTFENVGTRVVADGDVEEWASS